MMWLDLGVGLDVGVALAVDLGVRACLAYAWVWLGSTGGLGHI